MDQTNIYTYIGEEEALPSPPPVPLSWGRLLFLHILSSGLYSSYWLYCNWKILKLQAWSQGHHPFIKAIGSLIPVVHVFVLSEFFRQISKELQNKSAAKVSLVFYTLLLIAHVPLDFVELNVFAEESLNFLLLIFLATALSSLSLYFLYTLITAYRKENDNFSERHTFYWGEKLLITIFLIFWALMTMGFTYFPELFAE